MTSKEIRKELKDLVPVIIHYEDHYGGMEDVPDGSGLRKCLRIAIGFLLDPNDPSKGAVRDITLDPPDLAGKAEPANVALGSCRAITYLRPDYTVPYEVEIKPGAPIRLGRPRKRKEAKS